MGLQWIGRGGGTVEVRSEGGQGEPDIQLAHKEEKHSEQVPLLCISVMSDSRHLAAQLRSMADSMRTDWLQSQITAMLGTTASDPAGTQVRRARRARSPKRFSPSHSPRAQRHAGSPDSDPPAKPSMAS